MSDLKTLAHAVGVLLDPDSPEGVGTIVHYLIAALVGLAVPLTEIIAFLREGGWL